MTIDYALLARITGRHYRLLGRAIAGSRDNASTPTLSRPRPGPIERPGGKSKSNSHGGPCCTHSPSEPSDVQNLVFSGTSQGVSHDDHCPGLGSVRVDGSVGGVYHRFGNRDLAASARVTASHTHLPPARSGVGVLVFPAKSPGNSPVETLSGHWFWG